MPPPTSSAYSGPTGQIAKAVQSYAYSLLAGGSQEEAEKAAGLIVPPADIPQVAAMAQGAIKAGKAFGAETLATPYKPGGRQYAQFKSGMLAAQQEGMTHYLATIIFYFIPGGVMGLHMGAGVRSAAVQVDIPIGATYTQAQRIMEAAAREAAEGGDSIYAGTFQGFSVRTIIGM